MPGCGEKSPIIDGFSPESVISRRITSVMRCIPLNLRVTSPNPGEFSPHEQSDQGVYGFLASLFAIHPILTERRSSPC